MGTVFGDGCYRSDRCGDSYHQESEKVMNVAEEKCGIQGKRIIDQGTEGGHDDNRQRRFQIRTGRRVGAGP